MGWIFLWLFLYYFFIVCVIVFLSENKNHIINAPFSLRMSRNTELTLRSNCSNYVGPSYIRFSLAFILFFCFYFLLTYSIFLIYICCGHLEIFVNRVKNEQIKKLNNQIRKQTKTQKVYFTRMSFNTHTNKNNSEIQALLSHKVFLKTYNILFDISIWIFSLPSTFDKIVFFSPNDQNPWPQKKVNCPQVSSEMYFKVKHLFPLKIIFFLGLSRFHRNCGLKPFWKKRRDEEDRQIVLNSPSLTSPTELWPKWSHVHWPNSEMTETFGKTS